MNPSDLWEKVKARAEADTTAGAGLFASDQLGNAFIRGIFNNAPPEEAEMPYVVYDLDTGTPEDAFRTAVEDVYFNFSVYVPQDPTIVNPPDVSADAKASAIIARLQGDWFLQTYGTGPTYGFDRWLPVLAAPWNGGVILRNGQSQEHESDALHYVLKYRLHPSIVAV